MDREQINISHDLIKLLYRNHYASLIAIAYKYLRSSESSKDVVAEVFNKLLAINERSHPEVAAILTRNPMGYLSVVVKNKCLDQIRAQKSKQDLETSYQMLNHLETTNDSEKAFTKDLVEILTSKLEPREKEILLKHLDGFKNEEIAIELGISYNTVKNKIYDAKVKIKNIIPNL